MALEAEIGALERHLVRGELREAAGAVVRLLQRLEMRQQHFGGEVLATVSAEMEATRLAAAITQLLASPGYQPLEREGRGFLLFKRVVSQIFEVSGYRGTAHLRGLLAAGCRDAGRGPGAAEAGRLLMGLSLNASGDFVPALLKALPPAHGLLAVLAFLSEYLTWTPQAERMRTRLLQSEWLPERAALSPVEWTLLASAWMACSYADDARKHDIKEKLNRVVRDWVVSRGVADVPARRAAVPALSPDARPTLLIIAEIWYEGHAMDRCYRASVRALKKYFRTVLMLGSIRGRVDEQLFDEVDRTPFDAASPERFLQQARAHDGAIAYFPSVGMRIAGIAAANVRLAPIQIVTLGHPATTRSPVMDYMVMPDAVLGDPALFTETLLLRPSGPIYVGQAAGDAAAPEIRRRADPARLAVPAWIRKLTPRFLETCGEIARRAARPVEFWFFPNVSGVLYQAARRRLEDLLPGRVFPTTSYSEYMTHLGSCDVHLSSFPFGSSNGIVDSACQGLPIVNMTGPEAHSRIDAMLVARLGQPQWLTAANREQYVEATLRLVEDDALRVRISEDILASRPASHFLLPETAAAEDFGEIFRAVYLHHEQMQASGRKVWSYEDLVGLGATQEPVPAGETT